jgi:cardiolipin synthase
VLVVARDGAQLVAAAILRGVHRTIPVAPTRIGKYATFALAATVVLALASDFGGVPSRQAAPFVMALALLAAECVAISLAQYALFFWRALRAPGAGPEGRR